MNKKETIKEIYKTRAIDKWGTFILTVAFIAVLLSHAEKAPGQLSIWIAFLAILGLLYLSYFFIRDIKETLKK